MITNICFDPLPNPGVCVFWFQFTTFIEVGLFTFPDISMILSRPRRDLNDLVQSKVEPRHFWGSRGFCVP